MELGNLVFGHSRGNFEVPRGGAWENGFARLFDTIDENNDGSMYGPEFINETFEVHPYWWGECTCGKSTPLHAKDCPYVLGHDDWVSDRLHWASGKPNEDGIAELDLLALGYYPVLYPECTCGAREVFGKRELEREAVVGINHAPECYHFRYVALSDKYPIGSKDYDKLYEALKPVYAEYGWDTTSEYWYYGCATHCTCGFYERSDRWEVEHPHADNCKLVQPNFWYKPLDFTVQVYKYFLRDSFMSHDIKLKDLRKMIDACIASLKK